MNSLVQPGSDHKSGPPNLSLLSIVRLETAPQPITPVEYGGLQQAFDWFNAALFEGALPDALLTYQRKANSAGYFSPNRFASRIAKPAEHELALNPDVFADQSDEQICQTLVHEMAHLWQHVFGKPPKGGYHDRQWAAKMEALGLMPSSTGRPGGKKTGPRMMDYVISDGPFAKAYAALAATGWRMRLQSECRPKSKPGNDPSKTKFICPGCRANAWGKPSLRIACIDCLAQMTPMGGEAQQ